MTHKRQFVLLVFFSLTIVSHMLDALCVMECLMCLALKQGTTSASCALNEYRLVPRLLVIHQTKTASADLTWYKAGTSRPQCRDAPQVPPGHSTAER